MYLETLRLSTFKNYHTAEFTFIEQANCLLGPNGTGKTNALDAIHYLSFTKSALHAIDTKNIKYGENYFAIKGEFNIENTTEKVLCTYAENEKKRIQVNGQEPDRMADHIGKYPSILIAPNDTELIDGHSRHRRKFFDALIAQIDRPYLENLMIYDYHLKQRNSLFKQAYGQPMDTDLLDIYEQKMVQAGEYVQGTRQSFVEQFVSFFSHHYNFLAGTDSERVNVTYRANCAGKDLRVQLRESRQKDRLLQRTTVGIHRDDFLFLMNEYPVKNTASQGQQKSFLISLKLAAFQTIEAGKGFKPLLLLDDIFDKLDDERIDHLLTLVAQGLFGQLFITDARPERSRALLHQKNIASAYFPLDKK